MGSAQGPPTDDGETITPENEAVFKDRQKPLIVTGDFNFDMEEDPSMFKKVFKKDFALVDAFGMEPQATFEQDWGERHWFRLDYMFLSKMLNENVVDRKGGNLEFPSALRVSDHAPLFVELDLSNYF